MTNAQWHPCSFLSRFHLRLEIHRIYRCATGLSTIYWPARVVDSGLFGATHILSTFHNSFSNLYLAMVHLPALLSAISLAAVVPHTSFAAPNLTSLGITSQSTPGFKFPSLDTPALCASQNKTFEALFSVREEAPFFAEHISSSKRAISNLVSLVRTSGVWDKDHPIATSLDEIATDVQDIDVMFNRFIEFVDISSVLTLTTYGMLTPVITTLYGIHDHQDIISGLSRLPCGVGIEAKMKAVSVSTSQLFEEAVGVYETTCSISGEHFFQVWLVAQALDIHIALLYTVVSASYPGLFPEDGHINVFSALASILHEMNVDIPEADEVALRGVSLWTEKLASHAIEALTALKNGEQSAKAIREMALHVKISLVEQMESLKLGTASLRAAMERVGTDGFTEELAQKLKGMDTAMSGAGASQMVLQHVGEFAEA
ncbi:hypothetical protein BDY19DRAFT_950355 [Irpex rosettiformis]|uniref:Uncharacterized protein n=1 Tax=Irpex rosettiformis TaxID=378272 RepID=A0ACB8U2L8_9APHY|nr:hypothetical protein BDY19DRAFT_950355 [Irpex rosettiformis]